LLGGNYIAIKMYIYGGPKTALTRALPGGLYIAIIMDYYGGTKTALTIALPVGLFSHFNGTLLREPN
jgi:hypothetical protein